MFEDNVSIAEINTVNYGSTGKIMLSIQKKAKESGFNVKSYYGFGKTKNENSFIVGNRLFKSISTRLARLTGKLGCYSYFSTKKLIRQLKRDNVKVIHLHNLHMSFINLPLLFRFIKKENLNVIWTLHDCWAFTGHCPHFSYPQCDKWQTGCFNCSRYKEYPTSMYDNSKKMWEKKKGWFTGVKNMTIVTPSQWLADLVKQSFLKDYPVKVINNGIDLSIFKPADSNFREKYNLQNKFILLGVAFGWGVRKGFDVFIELSKRLNIDKFQIVLVGTNEELDKELPKEIISIHCTQNQSELAEIYSAVDLFVNPTREENYPTVNMESIACGTPVLTFRTGGSPEIVDEKTGVVVPCDDVEATEKEIVRIERERPFKREDCIAQSQNFDKERKFKEYVELYQKALYFR